MSDSSKKHSKSAAGEYVLKIFCYLIILLAITIFTAFVAIKPVTALVHKVESYVAMEPRDIELNDFAYQPNSVDSAEELPLNYGDKIANISSYDFGLNCSVYYGFNRISFSSGTGFYGGSALFGKGGASCIAGYMEGCLSALNYAAVDDVITVVTNYGEYKYRITDVKYADINSKNDYSTDSDSLVICGYTSDFSEHSGEALYVYAERIGEAE